jgi:hypothetical protein
LAEAKRGSAGSFSAALVTIFGAKKARFAKQKLLLSAGKRRGFQGVAKAGFHARLPLRPSSPP